MKLILQLLLILTIIVTISICTIQPEMHKNVMVYDSAYTPVTEEDVKTEIQNIPVMEVKTKPVQTTVKTEKKVEPAVTTTKTQTNNVKTQTKTAQPKTVTTAKQTVSKPTAAKTTTNVTTQKPVQTRTEVQKPKVETQKVEQKKVVTTAPQPTPVKSEKVSAPKVLTQQEETIAWNKWRSNLTNKIMQDTKLPDLPNGTLFHFSFNVDKYGKITNVQTGATPSNYTAYAIQYIAPVIRSYQGHSILNFPEGTARTSTTVTGKWRISNTERYSTPQDYNDVERIVR